MDIHLYTVCIGRVYTVVNLYFLQDMDGEWEAAKIDNPKCQEAPGVCNYCNQLSRSVIGFSLSSMLSCLLLALSCLLCCVRLMLLFNKRRFVYTSVLVW